MANYNSCFVCFDEIENLKISCFNPSCKYVMCEECFEELINLVSKNSEKLECPVKGCVGEFSFVVDSLSTKLSEKYYNMLWRWLSNEKKNYLDEKNRTAIYLEKIRTEKIKFIEETFPLAISHCAKIAFAGKLRKTNLEMAKRAKEESVSYRACFSIICVGKLKDWVCDVCEVKYCKECHRMDNENHKCKKEDVESLKIVENMIKCPKCGTPIVKSLGCNSMSCTRCKTNFNYATGNKTISGNPHNVDFIFKEYKTLYTEYSSFLKGKGWNSELLKLKEFNRITPKKPPENLYLSYLQKMMKKEKVSKASKARLGIKYREYIIRNFLYTSYYKCANIIEERYRIGKRAEDVIDFYTKARLDAANELLA